MKSIDMKPIIISVAALIVCVVILGLLFVIHDNSGVAEYNSGVCAKCGGNYVYQQAIGHYMTTTYIYICDHCGAMLETGKYMGR